MHYRGSTVSSIFKLTRKRPVSSVVETLLSVREVWDSNPGPVKSDTVPPMARHRWAFLWNRVAQALNHGNGPRHSLHACSTASVMKI